MAEKSANKLNRQNKTECRFGCPMQIRGSQMFYVLWLRADNTQPFGCCLYLLEPKRSRRAIHKQFFYSQLKDTRPLIRTKIRLYKALLPFQHIRVLYGSNICVRCSVPSIFCFVLFCSAFGKPFILNMYALRPYGVWCMVYRL